MLSLISVLQIPGDYLKNWIGSHCNETALLGQNQNIMHEKYDPEKFVQQWEEIKMSQDCDNSTTDTGSWQVGLQLDEESER